MSPVETKKFTSDGLSLKPINKIRSYVLADDIVAQKTFELSGFKKIAYLPKEKGEANVITLDKML